MKKLGIIGEIADFDYHGQWGDYTSPKSVKDFLASCADGERVEVEINSPGGSVIQGVEIANALKNSKAVCVAHVTGIAASMASVIACACDEIEMEEASFMMIHDPWGIVLGNAEDMRHEAGVLDAMKKVCMSFYRGKFKGCTEERLAELMSAETWYTGKECAEAGLDCRVIASDIRAAASISERKFANIPEAAAKFLVSKELTEEGKAEIEKARASAQVSPASQADESWEARYKGASKKINELQDRLAKAEADLSAAQSAKTELASAQATINDLQGKLEQSQNALADANASVSKLTGELDQVKKDLAKAGEHARHLAEVNATITGNVLIPSSEESYDARMASAIKSGTVNDRMALRKQKASGKIK